MKGLGNIKYLGPKIAGKIIECAEDNNVRPRIRAAALETIRTDPHKDHVISAKLYCNLILINKFTYILFINIFYIIKSLSKSFFNFQFKNFALNVMKNVDEDSELRIKAYLILAQCPCGKVAGAVKELLSKEESNQGERYILVFLFMKCSLDEVFWF